MTKRKENVMSKNYVLGGGVAGIIHSYISGNKIIDPNPLGQLGKSHILGPRLIQKTEATKIFLENLIENGIISSFKKRNSKIGFCCDGIVSDEFDENFLTRYVQATRGSCELENSFMSARKNNIDHYVVDYMPTGYSYKYLLEKIYNYISLKNPPILSQVMKIDLESKEIFLDNGVILNYDSLVSTVPIKVLIFLLGIYEEMKFEKLNKNFAIVDYNSTNDFLSSKYHYIYNVDFDKVYTRKTFYSDYVVYETPEPVSIDDMIEGSKVVKTYNSLPIQIMKSHSFEKYAGIPLLGRYAQWNHKVKIEDIIVRSLELEKIYA